MGAFGRTTAPTSIGGGCRGEAGRTGPVSLLAGDRVAVVQLHRGLGAVGLGDVRLVDAIAVGLDTVEGGPRVFGGYGRLDLRGGAAGQGRLAGTAAVAAMAAMAAAVSGLLAGDGVTGVQLHRDLGAV